MKTILDQFAMSVKRPTETYNPKNNVISAPKNYSQLKEHLTMLSKCDLENVNIKFFVERNPGWKKVSYLMYTVGDVHSAWAKL